MWVAKFGRKFETFEEYKEYVKSLTPGQVQVEFDYQSSQFTTKEVGMMYDYLKAALIHVNNRWSDTFYE